MQNNQTITNSTNDISIEIDALFEETKVINQETDEMNAESKKTLAALEKEINESITKVENIYTDLDAINKETEDELDKLILEESEILAKEENQ